MDPRIRRTRDAVLQSTLRQLAARGFGGFTMEGVAEESGASKSTIYRHWPTKLALVRDALEELNLQPEAAPDDGPAHVQVERLLLHLVTALHTSTVGACIPALVEAAEHHPDVAALLHQYSARRRARLVAVVKKGIKSGELRKGLDPELAAAALAGPIVYGRLMRGDAMKPREIRRLITLVLGARS
jgi:TetR/AcrR family transcriptional regulator of autoinduction and epiphytic fitness